jgi:hypothetical protein
MLNNSLKLHSEFRISYNVTVIGGGFGESPSDIIALNAAYRFRHFLSCWSDSKTKYGNRLITFCVFIGGFCLEFMVFVGCIVTTQGIVIL